MCILRNEGVSGNEWHLHVECITNLVLSTPGLKAQRESSKAPGLSLFHNPNTHGQQGAEPNCVSALISFSFLPPIFRVLASVPQACEPPSPQAGNAMSRMSPALCNKILSYLIQCRKFPPLAPPLFQIPYLVIVKSYTLEYQEIRHYYSHISPPSPATHLRHASEYADSKSRTQRRVSKSGLVRRLS